MTEVITSSDLLCLDDFVGTHPILIDLVYAKPHHPENMFKTEIYRPDAKMWGHKDLVGIVLQAAKTCREKYGWTLVIKDCLRTMEAQARMIDTDIVRANPHWIQEPNRLLSTPGMGGHPRGMAVDIDPVDENGQPVDMGTVFDYLTPDRNHNPAARNFRDFPATVLENRLRLENAMVDAAKAVGLPLLPLPQEWWDFRFPSDYSARFTPISDEKLPPHQRMTRPL